MSQRKKYLIDKKLQLGMTFSLLGVVLITSVLVISAITSGVVYNNDRIEEVLDVQKNIVEFLNSRIMMVENAGYKETLEKISSNHSSNISALKQIVSYNRILLITIIVLLLVLCSILYILGIKMTHRISGPVYVMTNYIRDVMEGRDPSGRPLRKKDELKDFYELLKEMVARLKGRAEER